MTLLENAACRSYAKSTAACGAACAVALLLAVLAAYFLEAALAAVLSTALGVLAIVAGTFALAAALVLRRCRRSARGEPDLFLELNRSRDRAPIVAGELRPGALRRWLSRRLHGHDLVVGELVEVRSWDEIRATLDKDGRLDHLPFMPEMLSMCGRRARVFRCVNRIFDYRKSRKMRDMQDGILLGGVMCDGAHHGGCHAACHAIWKSAWLRRIDPEEASRIAPAGTGSISGGVEFLQGRAAAQRFVCQLTQLHDASRLIAGPSFGRFLRPVVGGNVTLAAFAVGWLTHLFNELQCLRRGVTFPAFDQPVKEQAGEEPGELAVGDRVVMRAPVAIRATLSDRLEHRGMGFEIDMLKYCGQRLEVQSRVDRVIDLVTGEMRTMKTPAYILRDVHFSGERQLFNAQYEPLFWREVWLQRAPALRDVVR